MNYWLVRAKWGIENKKAEFINNDEWINGYADKYLEIVKRVETEDILLLADDSTITHYGKCIDNPQDGKHLTVDKWELLQEYISFPEKDSSIKAIVKVNDDKEIDIIKQVIEKTITSNDVKIKNIVIENFTIFKNRHTLEFSDGLNIIIGENGAGKTHLLKLLYALAEINNIDNNFFKAYRKPEEVIADLIYNSLINIFKPDCLNNLISYHVDDNHVSINLNKCMIDFKIDKNSQIIFKQMDKLQGVFKKSCLFISSKEMLSFYEGFIALHNNRDISFDDTYNNLAKLLELSNLKNIESYPVEYKLLFKLENILKGKIVLERGRFYLVSNEQKTEITLIAEGLRKIATIARLLSNGSLNKNTILFWDEPETNLNPKLMQPIVETLIELQRMGAQIFIATHDYVILKEFDLQCNEADKIMFHSLFKNPKTGEIGCHSTSNYLDISPNAIDDTFGNIIDREIYKSMGNLRK